jgi:hypothetical protein
MTGGAVGGTIFGVGERKRVGWMGVMVGKGDGMNWVAMIWVGNWGVIASGVMLGIKPCGVTVGVTVGSRVAVTTIGPPGVAVGVPVPLPGEAVPHRKIPTQ